MNTSPSARAAVPVRLVSLRGEWEGEVEAQGADHLRIRIRECAPRKTPEWRENEALDCILQDGRKEHVARATVIKQQGQTLWVRIPSTWDRRERRSSARARATLSVAIVSEDSVQFARCLDLAPGGMRLRVGESLPLEVPITLRFQLPGEEGYVELAAVPTRLGEPTLPKDAYEIGVRFEQVSPEVGARIARAIGDSPEQGLAAI